jgi:superfamily I DNA and/or RNA helicase
MNEPNKAIHLIDVIKELKISLNEARELLKSKGFNIELRPITKISSEVYKVLLDGFPPDRNEITAFRGISEERRKEIRAELEEKFKKRRLEEEMVKDEVLKSKADKLIFYSDSNEDKKLAKSQIKGKLIDLKLFEKPVGKDSEFKIDNKESTSKRIINRKPGRRKNLSEYTQIEKKKSALNKKVQEYSKNKDIWSKYILAQQKILEYRSLPIAVSNFNTIEIINNRLKLSVDQEIYKKVFKARIKTIFKLDNFDFSQNYILQDLEITDNIEKEKLLKLKEEGQEYYIEFNENPVLDGEIISKQNIKEQLEPIIGALPNTYEYKSDGLILLTIDKKVACEKLDFVEFKKKAGAVSPIYPSIKNLILKFNKNLDVQESENHFVKVSGFLDKKSYRVLKNRFNLSISKYDLHFKVVGEKDVYKIWKKLNDTGIELPRPINNTFVFSYFPNSFSLLDEDDTGNEFREVVFREADFNMKSKVIRLYKTLSRCFPKATIEFLFSTYYQYDYDMLWDVIYDTLHSDEIQVSRAKSTISFDFKDREELNGKLNQLKSIPYLGIVDYGNEHKFKYNIKFKSGLHGLQKKLKKELPNLSTRIVSNGEKLIFRQFYKSGNKDFIRDNLNDQLYVLVDEYLFNIKINNTFQEKFLCEENFELKVQQEDEKLSKLIREEFYFGKRDKKLLLGKLHKVNYPNLEFFVEDEQLEEVKSNIDLNEVKAIFPNLKGEQDKIIRLSNTIKKLESEKKLPNNNAKQFLFDSSMAKPIENIEYLLNPSSEEWREFDKSVFFKQLNEPQKQAIFKSLYAEELALIQGPPGTGKSTAIAEIIWQHSRKNQTKKILLTSETNLAVDNAIDRLKNNKHNIVKPIRFGNHEKLESEGRFYSITAIENWENLFESDEENAVSHWVNNIASRISSDNNIILTSSLSKWKNILKDSSKWTRKRFVEKYIEYANLIGATGSSIGKFNSQDRYTSFFHSYLNVFERKIYAPRINYEVCNKVNIVFDTVIMDEASKATPPELALPLLYGKKAIIVGDHRQLPPMVDGEDIKDTLISIGEKALAKTLSRTEFDKSQFESLFERIDPSIKGTFKIQYRMHPAINDVIKQFYEEDGGLNCGLPLEETSHTSFKNPSSRYHGLNYQDIIEPTTHVLWVNVDTPEIKERTSRVNFGEINAINNILKVIKKSDGIKEYNSWISTQTKEEKQIGIISFYGKQVNYLKKMLKESHEDVPIRLSTVDRFQGMERNIIIVSLVRSNTIASSKDQQPDKDLYEESGYPVQNSLGFAESPNRLNVALSRARRLLVIVGNKEHFSSKEIYKKAVETIISSESGKVIESDKLEKILNENEH